MTPAARGWWHRIFRRAPKMIRAEARFLPYAEADRLIRETHGAWTIAKEEDTNQVIGWVHLERLVPAARGPREGGAR